MHPCKHNIKTKKLNQRCLEPLKSEGLVEQETLYWIYYPLSGRMQKVSVQTFKRVDGQFVEINSSNKCRINYPSGYPVEKRVLKKRVVESLQRAFHCEGFVSDLSRVFKTLSRALKLVGSVDGILSHITAKIDRKLVARTFSILLRFVRLCESDRFDLLASLALLSDLLAVKEDVEERFSTEGIEDVALLHFINLLPTQLRTVIMCAIAAKKKEAVSFEWMQAVFDLMSGLFEYMQSLQLPSCILEPLNWFKNFLIGHQENALLGECTKLVLDYRNKPNLLSQDHFIQAVEDVSTRLDCSVGSNVVAHRIANLAKHDAGVKTRVDAFRRLEKLVKQVKGATRLEPSCFVFDGPPGLLKSVTLGKLLRVLGRSVYVHHVKNISDGKDFYDMYDNQEVFYMDDVGQQGKSQWRNLINWVSCIPLPLDCAEASLKNTKLFNSEIIMLTTNQFMDLHGFTSQDGVSEPEALFRRAFVFDWSKVKNESGVIGGSLSVKRFDMKTKKWTICSAQELSGEIVIRDQSQCLSWMASWVETIVAWKKNNAARNVLSESVISDIRENIRVRDYCTEGSKLEFFNQHTIFDQRGESYLRLDVGSEDYDSISRYHNILIQSHTGQESVFCDVSAWTVKDAWLLLLDKLTELLEKVLHSVVGWLLTGEAWRQIVMFGSMLLVLVVVWFSSRSLCSAEKADADTNWDSIKSLCTDSVSSQVRSIQNNHVVCVKFPEYKAQSCGLVFDKYVVIPAHMIKQSDATVLLTVSRLVSATTLMDSVRCEIVSWSGSSDMAVCKLPKSSPIAFKNLEFGTKSETLYLVTPVGSIPMQNILKKDYLGDIPYSAKGEVSFSNVIKVGQRILYKTHFRGLCGSVVCDDQGGIVGHHVAGSDSDNMGVTLVWPQEVLRSLNNLERSFTPFVVHETQLENSSGLKATSPFYKPAPNKSSLVASPYHGIYPVDRFPADLTKYGKKTVDKVFEKSTGLTAEVVSRELAFGEEVLRGLLPDFTDISDEMIVRGYDNINGINRKSSNGHGCSQRKSDYFDFEIGRSRTAFLEEIRDVMHNLAEGVFDDKLLWVESLKDELRNSEKDGVPRSFRVSTVHLQYITKKLTADLVSKVMRDRLSNCIQIGCNPIVEWPRMFQDLSSRNVFAGDIAKWDGAMVPQVQRAVNGVIIEKYRGVHKEVLVQILENLVNTPVLVGGSLFLTTHSMPSGSFLTAFYNSLVNRFYTAMWYARHTLHPVVGVFNQEVLDFVYGDDKVVGVSKTRTDLTAVTMERFFSDLGMGFTDANKNPIISDYQPLSEISFLKRDFTFHNELGTIVCPLSLRTLQNTIAWIDSRKEMQVVLDGKIDSIWRELYLHEQRESLMQEFKMKVESVTGPRRWLSINDIKSLYMYDSSNFLIKNFLSYN